MTHQTSIYIFALLLFGLVGKGCTSGSDGERGAEPASAATDENTARSEASSSADSLASSDASSNEEQPAAACQFPSVQVEEWFLMPCPQTPTGCYDSTDVVQRAFQSRGVLRFTSYESPDARAEIVSDDGSRFAMIDFEAGKFQFQDIPSNFALVGKYWDRIRGGGFQPMRFLPNYSEAYFEVCTVREESYDVLVNPTETKRLLRPTGGAVFQTWPEYLKSGPVAEARRGDRLLLRTGPSKDAAVLDASHCEGYRVDSLDGEWLRGTCWKGCFEGTDESTRGWVRWYTGTRSKVNVAGCR